MPINPNPTESQIQQSAIAHEEFCAVLDRLVKEGFDYRSILSGASAALAQSIMVSAGPAKVSEWFAMQSALTMSLAQSKPD
ncbi:hypothetical protein TomMM35A_18430 [Sphingobium sp. TomMM35A]